MGVLPMAETIAARFVDGDGALAVLEPFLGQLGVVLARAERTGNGRGRERRPFGAVERRAVGKTVNYAAASRRAVLQIFVSLIDDRLGDRDAGIAGGAERLHLGDGHRAFVKAAAVGAGNIAPTAARRLRLADK